MDIQIFSHFCLWKYIILFTLIFIFLMTKFEWNLINLWVLQPLVRKTFFIATQHAHIQWNRSFTKQCYSNCMIFFFFPFSFPFFLYSFLFLFSLPFFCLLNAVHCPLNWFKDSQKDYHPRWKRNHCLKRPKIHFPFSHPCPISSLTYSVNWNSYGAMVLRFLKERVWSRRSGITWSWTQILSSIID